MDFFHLYLVCPHLYLVFFLLYLDKTTFISIRKTRDREKQTYLLYKDAPDPASLEHPEETINSAPLEMQRKILVSFSLSVYNRFSPRPQKQIQSTKHVNKRNVSNIFLKNTYLCPTEKNVFITMDLKKLVLATALFAAFYFPSLAQLSRGGIPPSFDEHFKTTSVIPVVDIEAPDMVKVKMEDDLADLEFKPYRVATLQKVGVNFMDVAASQKVKGGTIWRLQLSSYGALGLAIYSDHFHIPKGGRLFAYDPEHDQLLGAFSENNNNPLQVFAMDFILGENIILEYFCPENTTEEPVFEISEVAYGYRGMDHKNSSFGSSGGCNVNMACSEGDNYRNQGNAVVRISIRNAYGIAFCSGTLLNNTRNDNTPLILTAGHCLDDEGDNPRYTARYVYRFNFETSDCENPSGYSGPYHTLTGGDLLAYDSTYGDLGDFALFKLKDNVPDYFNAFWCGWDRRDISHANGVGIHHPSGDVKKISTYTRPLITTYYPGGHGTNSHFKVYWARTEHGYGITEGGSSGSALFSEEGLVIGDLTGGTSDCFASDARKSDFYGRINYNWNAQGSDRSKLRPWLDPENTGVMKHSGMNKDGNLVSLIKVKDQEKSSLLEQVTPMPFKENLNVVFAQTARKITLQIADMKGVVLHEETIGDVAPLQTKAISLGKLVPGIYVLTITCDQGMETHKIIKE